MNPIEKLLGETNRLFEETVDYLPADAAEPITVPATRETIETAQFMQDGAPQSWRLVAFSFDRNDLEGITPKRGDRLNAKDGNYRLVEFGGLAYTPRFDAGFQSRILIYFERDGA